jgi:cytidine deaminase
MTNKELIKKAASVIKAKRTANGLFGDVGCAVLSAKGHVYLGICADSGSNVLCAEKVALGSMITAGEYQFKKIVAVWKDKKGIVFVIPPCGNCRQFMREIDQENLSPEIILDGNKTVSLKELLPYHDWWCKQR